MNWLLVAAGAAVGAPLRYLTDRYIQSRHDSVFPWGTFTVNVLGSALLGLIAGATTPIHLAIGIGFCGALTTYSTFSYETLRLAQTGALRYAFINVTASVVAGVCALLAGHTVGSLLWSR